MISIVKKKITPLLTNPNCTTPYVIALFMTAYAAFLTFIAQKSFPDFSTDSMKATSFLATARVAVFLFPLTNSF